MIEVIGIHYSTFARTVVSSLRELNIEYNQLGHLANSPKVLEYNPFGFIPVFVRKEDGKDIVLYETSAIARYIDSEFSRKFRGSDLRLEVEIEKWISMSSSQVFNAITWGIVKARIAAEKANKPEEQIKQDLATPNEKANKYILILEGLFKGPYVTGEELTWADLFLYPILADYKSMPEGAIIQRGGQATKIAEWMERMEQRDSFKNTYKGSVADLRNSK
ncbi:glutathione S-transferase [Acrasis kona]|uniref:Glutathione S-transferase n=1 Tax=Acrasis kona TaxID=1008807 RepID=A0AAW2ZP85_9EUKA